MKLALLALLVSILEPLDAERPAKSSVSLSFIAYSSEPDAIDHGEAAKIRIEAVWLGMQDAQIRPASSCKRAEARMVVSGPFTTELVKRFTTVTETEKVDVARYCAFEVHLRRTRGKAPGAPSELRGASIVIQGRRGDGVRFLIRSRLDTAVSLRSSELEGFAISESSTGWILGVDLSRSMAGLDLSIADVKDGPRGRDIIIDEKSNPDLLSSFNANFAAGFSLFEDRDGDRELDTEERAHPIAVRR